MAIFNDVRDIERTGGRTKPFEKTTGWRKNALSILGYNDDGTKNTFGKYFGHGNVLLDHYAPRALAKGDSKEVIASGEADNWGSQFASAQYATNFIGGGSGGGIGSMFKKDGGGEAGSGIDGSSDATGGVQSDTNTNTSSFNNVQELYSTKKNDEALAKLNYNVNSYEDNKSMDDDSILDESDYVNDDSLYDDELLKEKDYINLDENGEEILDADDKEISGLGKGKESMDKIPVVGGLVGGALGVKQKELITAKNLERKRNEIRRKSLIQPSKQNYL